MKHVSYLKEDMKKLHDNFVTKVM